MRTIIEPFRIRSVEPIRLTTPEHRREVLRRCRGNLFRIRAEDVVIDLLTDSGTGAMSIEQWAGLMRGDESYAGAASYDRFRSAVERITGFTNILPTHQGRAAERILFEALLGPPSSGPGRLIAANAHFDTTRANIEHSGAAAIDLLPPAALVPAAPHPFKGDIDLAALEGLLRTRGGAVAGVLLTLTCNSNGGQPVSLANARAARALCDRHAVPLILDAARFAENAWLIRQREPGQQARRPAAIARDLFDLADIVTLSAKKDGLVNIGGMLLVRDDRLFRRASSLLILTEGFVTYGGLAGRDLEAIAIGLQESLEEDYLRYRVRSIEYLGEKLLAAGVPIVQPTGGHAVYIDAAALCPQIARRQFPGQALACALYVHGGVRACEIGSVMMGDHARLELLRLAIPRRTYTQSHIDYVAEAVLEVAARAGELRGLRIVDPETGVSRTPARDRIDRPDPLRHFTASFEPADHEAGGLSDLTRQQQAHAHGSRSDLGVPPRVKHDRTSGGDGAPPVEQVGAAGVAPAGAKHAPAALRDMSSAQPGNDSSGDALRTHGLRDAASGSAPPGTTSRRPFGA
jgi:tryptophanase